MNVASRMETTSLPGKIQVTEAVYEVLKDSFVFVPRGVIEVKGKGAMQTYFLESIIEVSHASNSVHGSSRPPSTHVRQVSSRPQSRAGMR